ncbi:outer membrane protein assembly factor BamB family protein [Sunxiuqinia sp. A32]|uniref:outer membrane protein assembly factor BamB family protein n=1 Tax=Sunxiuqinia sp. A32 TaxID=3461496 RepID=UPI00404620A3
MSISVKDKINISRAIAWFSALFSLMICVLLIANYLQFKSVDPLESKALNTLVERLKDNPQDEALKEDIRALDLLIRKAYFTSQWQVRTGAYMLIFGVILFTLAVRYRNSLKSKLDELEGIEKDPFLDKQLARKWVIYAGGGLFTLALVAGFLSFNSLEEYSPKQLALTDSNDNAGNNPEVIQITTKAEQESSEIKEEAIVEEQAQGETETPKEVATDQQETSAVQKETEKPTSKPAVSEGVTLAELKKNYPFFRGPQGNGVAWKTNTPENWDGATGENVLWKVKTPKHGYNSPIIWGDKLFISGADKTARQVYCYDRNTGALLWQANADNIPGSPAKMPNVTEDTGLAAPTMATNGNAVFAIFGTGDLISFDMNGNRLWAKNLGVPDNHYGHSSSLVIYKDKLIVQYDTNKGGKVMAFNTASGEPAWETIRSGVRISWASPVLVDTGNQDQLILNAEPLVASYDPNTGEELWKAECMMGEVGPSVGYTDGIAYAANEYATLAAIDVSNGEILWEDNEYLPEVSSPLAADGLLVIATSYGVLACYDPKDGTKYWEQEYNDGFYGSAILADGKIYIMDMSGKMHIIKMAKEFELVAEPELGEKAASTPAFSDGRIYLRGFENLYCIGK